MLKRMLSWSLWVLGVLLILILAVLALGPFLIFRDPAPGVSDAQAAATPESRFLAIPFPGTRGLEIHYLARGPAGAGDADASGRDKPVFLMLHGFTLNSFSWAPVLDAFAARGRVLAYDQIPYGLSAKPADGDWSGENPYAKEAALAQLFAVMDGLGVERAILAGSSSGGTLALEAALARPDRVQALILAAPWVYAQRPTLPRTLAELPQMRRVALFGARKLGEHTLLGLSYLHPERISPERRDLAVLHRRVAGWDLGWGELLDRSLFTPVDVGERLAQVAQPALVVAGSGDKLVKPEDSKRVAELLGSAVGGRADFVLLPDCGHVPQEECPDAFLAAVLPWLDGLHASP